MCLARSTVLSVFAVFALALPLAAGGVPSSTTPGDAPADAQRMLEIARLQLRLYERVEYPLRLQELDGQIKLTQAEVESLLRRIAEYERFNGSKALFLSLENTRLQLLGAELRLKNLKQEQLLLQLHFKDERRLRQLLVEEAQRRASASAGTNRK